MYVAPPAFSKGMTSPGVVEMTASDMGFTRNGNIYKYIYIIIHKIYYYYYYIYIYTRIYYTYVLNVVWVTLAYIGVLPMNVYMYMWIYIYIAIIVMMMQLDKSGSIFLASSNDLSLSLSILCVYTIYTCIWGLHIMHRHPSHHNWWCIKSVWWVSPISFHWTIQESRQFPAMAWWVYDTLVVWPLVVGSPSSK